MLTYKFMQVAFLVCILLGIVIPLLGSSVVFKRLSSSGDALAHSSLAGVAIGLASGLNPLWASIICCVVAFLIIELLRKRFSKFSEIGVSVVLSASIALAGILSSFTTASNFDSYLFGSVLLISDTEMYLTVGLFVITLVFSFVFAPQIFSCLYSESEAKVSGIRVRTLTFFQDLLFSIAIAISAKVVGSLVVTSLVVLPTAIALQLRKGYKATMLFSLGFSLVSMVAGLTAAYYLDLKPGATIVMVLILLLVFSFLVKGVVYLIKRGKSKKA